MSGSDTNSQPNSNSAVANAFLNDSRQLLEQSMIKLQHCFGQLTEQQLWWRPHPSTNSIGNLTLHICGNLRQWSIAGVAGEPDTRDREGEFKSDLSMSATELIEHLQSQVQPVLDFLNTVTPQHLLKTYTIQGFLVGGLQAINHTVTHFVGHTHQVILLTRIQLGDKYLVAWGPDSNRDQLPI